MAILIKQTITTLDAAVRAIADHSIETIDTAFGTLFQHKQIVLGEKQTNKIIKHILFFLMDVFF